MKKKYSRKKRLNKKTRKKQKSLKKKGGSASLPLDEDVYEVCILAQIFKHNIDILTNKETKWNERCTEKHRPSEYQLKSYYPQHAVVAESEGAANDTHEQLLLCGEEVTDSFKKGEKLVVIENNYLDSLYGTGSKGNNGYIDRQRVIEHNPRGLSDEELENNESDLSDEEHENNPSDLSEEAKTKWFNSMGTEWENSCAQIHETEFLEKKAKYTYGEESNIYADANIAMWRDICKHDVWLWHGNNSEQAEMSLVAAQQGTPSERPSLSRQKVKCNVDGCLWNVIDNNKCVWHGKKIHIILEKLKTLKTLNIPELSPIELSKDPYGWVKTDIYKKYKNAKKIPWMSNLNNPKYNPYLIGVEGEIKLTNFNISVASSGEETEYEQFYEIKKKKILNAIYQKRNFKDSIDEFNKFLKSIAGYIKISFN